MADSTSSGARAGIEALLARAEADLAALGLRLRRGTGPPADPSDPADPGRCLEIWIAALRAVRAPPALACARPLPRRRRPCRGFQALP